MKERPVFAGSSLSFTFFALFALRNVACASSGTPTTTVHFP